MARVAKPAAKKVPAKAATKTTTKAATKAVSKPSTRTSTKISAKTSTASSRNWSWLLGLGVLFVIFGFLGLSSVIGVTLISIVFIGFMFLIGGVLQFVDVFKSKKWKVAVWHGLIAVMYFIGGCFIVWDPLLASTVITALIGWTLVVIGLVRLVMALSLHGTPGWIFTLVASLAAIVLGGIILMQWPLSSLWVIGLFISIELLLNGLSYVIMAFSMRNHSK